MAASFFSVVIPECIPACSVHATCMENNTCVCNLNYEGDGITCTGESSVFPWEIGADTGEEWGVVTPAGLHPDPSTACSGSATMPVLSRTLFINGLLTVTLPASQL